ncbi:MAG TPA: hypothetical protein VMT74_09000 [Gaiellaceae bacterium]|nr:hypothetical protein [Gaiellaceae bacterium]
MAALASMGRVADEWRMESIGGRPSTRLTWIAAALGCGACALAARMGADARWLAAMGASMLRAGAIPHAVPYAAAPSAGWHDAPALGQLVFHWLETLAGDRGLIVAQVAAVGVALAALALDLGNARVRDGSGAAVLLATFLALPAAFLVVRAELFSLALFPVLLLLVRSDDRRRSHRIWLVVPLLVLWANLHGGVLVGLFVLAVYLLLRRLRRAPAESTAVLALSGIAVLATPQLLGSVDYYTGVLRGPVVSEGYGLWGPLTIDQPLDLLLVAIAIPLVILALRSRPATWELLVLALLIAGSVEARRDGLWLLLFTAAPAARGLSRTGMRTPPLSGRVALVCACVPLLMLTAGLSTAHTSGGAGAQLVRRAMLAAHGGPILADPLDAEKLALAGGRVWIANPIEAFAPSEQRLYLAWLRGEPSGAAILQRRIHVVLVLRGSEPQRRLAADPAFRVLAEDDQTVLYRRTD